MHKKIMVALDGSEVADRAFDAAVQLAVDNRAVLQPVYVVEYPSPFGTELGYDWTVFHDYSLAEGQRVARACDQRMRDADVGGASLVIDASSPGNDVVRQLQQAADAFGADLVVLGTHGRRGFRRLVIGSVAERFVRSSPRPVLLIPGQSLDDADPAV